METELKLKTAFGDGDPTNPQGSMTRLCIFLVVMSCVCLPMLAWFWLSMIESKLQPIPEGLTMFMGAAGILFTTLFAFNKATEQKST